MALNVMAAMRKYGIKQKDVAAKLEITPTGLSQHINGNPTINVLTKIADAIGCDISELFDQKASDGKIHVECPHCHKRLMITIEEEHDTGLLVDTLGNEPMDEKSAAAFFGK